MRQRSLLFAALAILILSFAPVRAASQAYPSAQPNPNPPSTADTGASTNKKIEQEIRTALKHDPHVANAKVGVHASGDAIILSGTVASAEAKDEAEQIANQHANGKKITNRIKVNPNVHPGPGL